MVPQNPANDRNPRTATPLLLKMPIPKYTVECISNEVIANKVHEIRMTKPDGFVFKAGQFVMFDVPLVDNPEDTQVRAYSIASTPDEEQLLFVIKLMENGRMSNWVEQKLVPGSTLEMQGPLGVFGIKDTGKESLFVCTSTGNAPFRSMILDALQNGNSRRMDMIFGVRSEEDLFWVDEFKALAQEYENFYFHPSVTQPGPDWKGHRGRVQTLFRSVCCNLAERTLYACGNPAMTTEVKEICRGEHNMDKADVHIEGYI